MWAGLGAREGLIDWSKEEKKEGLDDVEDRPSAKAPLPDALEEGVP